MEYLPDWIAPIWPPYVSERLALVGTTLAALGMFFYLYIKRFHDWIIDEIVFISAVVRFSRALKAVKAKGNGIYSSARVLEDQAKRIPNKTYLLFENQKYSFAEVNAKANQVANALRKLGIVKGDNLSLLMKNKPEFTFVYYACLKIAVPQSFINTNLRAKVLLHAVRLTSTRYLVLDDDEGLIAAVDEIADELEMDGVKIFVYGNSTRYVSLTETIEKCCTDQPDEQARNELKGTDVAFYIFTSGTTGLPKAARVPYRRIGGSVAFSYLVGIRSDDVLYAPLPLYHSSTYAHLDMAVYLGATFAFASKFSASGFWKDCNRYNVTVIQYIGETCRYLLSKPPSDFDGKHKIRLALGNGLRNEIWDEFQTRFNIKRIFEFFASTEGTSIFVNSKNKKGACGRRHPIVMALSRTMFLEYNVEKEEICRGEDGFCIVAPRGKPGLMVTEITENTKFEGYSNEKDTDSKILRNVLKTGDLYYNSGDMLLWDTDYYVYFVDRVGDTFRWKGENVSTLEVESLICSIDVVEDCCIYGVAIPDMDGKCGMGAIVLKAGVKQTEEVLKDIYLHCEQFLPSYARPIFIRFMPELQLTGTFKHQKCKLKLEGYDFNSVSDVYVHDVKLGTYIPLTSDVYDSIRCGSVRI